MFKVVWAQRLPAVKALRVWVLLERLQDAWVDALASLAVVVVLRHIHVSIRLYTRNCAVDPASRCVSASILSVGITATDRDIH